MNINAEKLMDYLKEKNMRYQASGDNTVVVFGNTDKIKGLQIIVQFKDVKNGPVQFAQVHVAKLCPFPDEKKGAMYKLCNKLNMDYCGVSFYVGEDNNAIHVNIRSFISSDDVASDVYSDIVSLAYCIDEAYPQIMKEIWS